ncbi:MAG: winged helix-turn-helix domain-containing protein, partial [Eubacteriales bacterium]|nr:winged helix-turn-helix domain-containing protein [Eubacteriales bacterium]
MLEIIRMVQKEPLTRAEIARRTGLTRAAVTIIADRLTGDGVLQENSVSGKSGTLVRQLAVCPQRFLFLGLDLRRDGYTAGLADLGGETLDSRAAPLDPGQSFEQLIESVKSDLNRLAHPLVTGVGVGVPG